VTRTLAELVLLVALLAVAWAIVVSNGRLKPPVTADATGGAGYRAEPVDAGLPERAEALRAYIASPPPPTPAQRNPFSFRNPSRADVRPDDLMPEAAVAADGAPSGRGMELEGIAEDTGNGHPLRTAIIAAAGDLILAKEGDRILSRYLVVRITTDAVQLKDEEEGVTFSVVLK
jgi:hypothetical protein